MDGSEKLKRIGFFAFFLLASLVGKGQDSNFQFIQNSDSSTKRIQRIFICAGSSNNCEQATLESDALVELASVSLGTRYTILERKYLDALLEEQRRSLSGIVFEETTVAAGCLQGSEAIVFCNIECVNGKSVVVFKMIDCAEGVQHWIAQGVNVDAFSFIGALSSALDAGVSVTTSIAGAGPTDNLNLTSKGTTGMEQECNPVQYQGYTYDVVKLGNGCWFKENLKAKEYLNGDLIEEAESSQVKAYADSRHGAYLERNLEFQLRNGQVYNWYAVADKRGLCPSGWRVSSDADWKDLELAFGMDPVEVNSIGYRGGKGFTRQLLANKENEGLMLRPQGFGLANNEDDWQAIQGDIYEGYWTSDPIFKLFSWYRNIAFSGIYRENSPLGIGYYMAINSGYEASVLEFAALLLTNEEAFSLCSDQFDELHRRDNFFNDMINLEKVKVSFNASLLESFPFIMDEIDSTISVVNLSEMRQAINDSLLSSPQSTGATIQGFWLPTLELRTVNYSHIASWAGYNGSFKSVRCVRD